jgi:uncharacterized protein YcfJ
MQRPLLAGMLLVAGAMVSIGAVAGLVAATRPQYATVASVEPVVRLVTVRKQECAEARTLRRLTGTTIGGMVGGVIGHQYGEVRPRTDAAGKMVSVATGAPSAMRGKCRTVYRTEQQVHAYDVRYRLEGRLGKVRLDHHPGDRIPVKAGRLVLTDKRGQPVKG